MYEKETFEALLNRLLGRMRTDLERYREGSINWDAAAAAALEFANLYTAADGIYLETFADTASREFLIRRAAERGIVPYPATYSLVKGEFNQPVPIGSRFSCDKVNYVVTEPLPEANAYKLQCESIGAEGNHYLGDLIPIEYLPGLTKAEATEVLIPGEDQESTESIRKRYMDSLHNMAFGGNIADYKLKVNAISGVGGVKVYPVWNGGGTVKLVLIDSDFNPPAEDLIEMVQKKIDPPGEHGHGNGIAPIGHSVTVAGCIPCLVDVEMQITYQEGYSWNRIGLAAQRALEEYFAQLREQWADKESLVVRISQIETRILDLEGVVDIMGTKINGAERNLALSSDEVPVGGELVG